MARNRTADRAPMFDLPQRLSLAESDLDTHDETFERLNEELAKIKGILIGILVAVTTACIMLAVNLGVGA